MPGGAGGLRLHDALAQGVQRGALGVHAREGGVEPPALRLANVPAWRC